jgi:hypothetical protein
LFALHLLNGHENSPEPSVPSAPRTLGTPAAPNASSAAPSGSALAPDTAAMATQMATNPEDTLHSLAGLLPHDEREAQRLNALEVRALVAQGRVTEAKERARGYFERWPNGPDTAELERLTAVHPAPHAP